ncbi:hypothetical protein TRFO_11575 [Tritrichomonas foetus]|uniref:C2 domain-containing protein n=1 Tax=Tritrichomonas foetus TaxID=1144522 RepID=A0A1J4J2X1_9EUKA|nr:hypothetical protein TRFO_11575 [Tritrichomonas foetus]|eukprot:OHS93774.1 hypothetical protein TRFO_11575 [Tritrichomonas foetus]
MKLHVKVVEANDLPKMDLIGKVDPYCILQMGTSKKYEKTRVINSNYNPVWNETFSFTVGEQLSDLLHILVKDHDTIAKDEAISKLMIKLSDLPFGIVTENLYNLMPVGNVKKGGKIRLVLHLCKETDTPFTQCPKSLPQYQPNIPSNMQPNIPSNMQPNMPSNTQPNMYSNPQAYPGIYEQYNGEQSMQNQQQQMMMGGYPPNQMPMQQFGGYPQMPPQYMPNQVPTMRGYPQQQQPIAGYSQNPGYGAVQPGIQPPAQFYGAPQ